MYLGIDLGTSAVKTVLVDAAGAVVGKASRTLTVQSPHPGWSEQEPEDWWNASRACCVELSALPGWRDVRAIGLSGQMHGATCLDDAHRPVRPAILWNDGRSHAECAEMLAGMPEIGALAGVVPMPGFTAPKLRWMARAEPEVHARIRHILLPKDYLRLKLTGDLATDMADAAGTLWLDQQRRQWSEALCAVSATDMDWLPTLFEGTEVTGVLTAQAASELGLNAGVPVAAGGGDAATGAIGLGAIEDGDAFLSLGTSGQLFLVTDAYRPEPETLVHAYAHCIPDRWFQMAAMLNGASALGWWANTVRTPIETLLAEVEASIPTDVPLFLPYLNGERTPHNDPHIRGAFYGLTGPTGRAAMTQAVLDAIAYTFCDAQAALARAGSVIDSPAVIGGGARSERLLQTIADAMGITLRRYADAEAGPALGAARLAMIAAGARTIREVAVSPEVDRVFEPAPQATAHHQARLVQFRRLYNALAPLAAETQDSTLHPV